MDVSLVVEAQDGLNWRNWREILHRVERLGYRRLYRSDHFFVGEQRDSLEANLSFVMAASETTSLRFGSLVTPITFRSPVDIARAAAQIDDLSEGRFILGLGVGWYEAEHRAYGIPLPPLAERFDRLEEAVDLIRALWGDVPATFDGRYYSVDGADLRPKPRYGRIPLMIGGVGERRTLPLIARKADIWGSECISVEDYAHKTQVLDRECELVGRDPATVWRAMVVVGDVVPSATRVVRGAVKGAMALAGRRDEWASPFTVATRAGGLLVGGRQQIIDELARYAQLGLQEAIFKFGDVESHAVAEYLADEVLPAVRGL